MKIFLKWVGYTHLNRKQHYTTDSSMDYKNGKIYCIRNTNDYDVYVGATCSSLSKRMAQHRRNANKHECAHYLIYKKMNNIGIENCYIELIENYPCNNVDELRAKEGEHIRQIGTLNKIISGRTQKLYVAEHSEKTQEYQKKYREDHKEHNKKYKQNYYNNNKDKMLQKKLCHCGKYYTVQHKMRHERTKRHI